MIRRRLSLGQLALAAGAPVKWIKNAELLLGLSFPRTPREAFRLGLMYELHTELSLPLAVGRSIAIAAQSLRGAGLADIPVGASESVRLRVDLNRYHSTFNARLSRARLLGGAKRRGRPRSRIGSAITAARDYGVDVSLIRESLGLSTAERLDRLQANAEFVKSLTARRVQ